MGLTPMEINIQRRVDGTLGLNESELLWLSQALDAALRGNLWASPEPQAWASAVVQTVMPQLLPG